MKNDTRNRLVLPILLPIGILAVIAVVLFAFSRILLSVKPDAATVTALVVAAAVLTAAAIAASRERVRGATIGGMLGTVAGVAMLTGGVAIVAIGPEEPEIPPFHATLAAPSGASVDGFEPTELSLPSDKPIDLEFDNSDDGVTHNVVIFDGEDDSAPQLFRGAPVTGVANAQYHVPALPAGTFFFHCEFHTGTMTGTITAAPAPTGPSPGPGSGSAPPPPAGGGNAVTIQALPVTTFSTNSLSWKANTAVTVTLDNQDAGNIHDFSLYRDEGYTDSIAKTDNVTSGSSGTVSIPELPPGTYYFRCDLHPPPTFPMFGTVTVS
ncbi:MAG TPA: cupredoxin domain-containing protein [Actinomycetota bacterium]